MRPTSQIFFTLAAALVLSPLVGCSGTEQAETNGLVQSPPGGTGGAENGGGGGQDQTTGQGGTGNSGPEVCPESSEIYEAKAAPSNVLFLFDRSGSMHLLVDENTTRWTAAEAG